MKTTILPKNLQSDEYKSSRILYYFEVALEYLISVITSGVYLAKLTTTIGISEGTTAVLSTIGSLAGIFQILSIFLAHKRPLKKWIAPFRLVEQLLRAGMFLLPFLTVSTRAISAIFFAMTLVYQILYNASTPAKTVWFMNLVDKDKQGSFVAISKIVSLAIGMVTTLIFGIMLDKFEAGGNINEAFILIAIILLATSVVHLLLLLFAKEKPEENAEKKTKVFADVSSLFKNKAFVIYLAINTLWSVAAGLSMPFMNTYKINELGFNMTTNSILEVVFSVINIIFFFVFGKLSSKAKNLAFLKWGYAFYAVHFIIIAFVNPITGLPMFIAGQTIYLIGLSAVTIGSTIIYRIVKESEYTAALAFITIASGVFGFLTTLAFAPLFEYVQANLNFELFGTKVYAQQLLNLASALTTAVLLILLSIFVKEPNESENDEDEQKSKQA